MNKSRVIQCQGLIQFENKHQSDLAFFIHVRKEIKSEDRTIGDVEILVSVLGLLLLKDIGNKDKAGGIYQHLQYKPL